MQRLKAKDSPDRKELNQEQKTKIDQVNKKYTAKAAERQIFLQKQIAEAEMAGNYEEVQALQKQLRSELDVIKEEKEAAKDEIRNP